jgi:hypothetical protein
VGCIPAAGLSASAAAGGCKVELGIPLASLGCPTKTAHVGRIWENSIMCIQLTEGEPKMAPQLLHWVLSLSHSLFGPVPEVTSARRRLVQADRFPESVRAECQLMSLTRMETAATNGSTGLLHLGRGVPRCSSLQRYSMPCDRKTQFCKFRDLRSTGMTSSLVEAKVAREVWI